MRPSYQQELDALPQTYAELIAADLEDLDRAVARLGSGPASFIGSGGMAAVASFAAQLHEQACLEPGLSISPLAAISRPPLTTAGALLFTSSGRHPDAREVMRRLGQPGMRPGIVLTHRRRGDLPDLTEAAIVTLPPLPVREGFLAVNSVLSMCIALVRAYLGDVLPDVMPAPDHTGSLPKDLDRLLVLYPPSLAPVAVDVEARLVEIGLAAVQLADLRNFAHGRHTGLARNIDRTTLLVLSDEESLALADATVGVLPDSVPMRRWHTDASWPDSVLQQIVRSMHECGHLGDANQVNVGRPQVPVYGRRLYRLPVRKKLPESVVGPIERKLRGVGGVSTSVHLRQKYEDALRAWSSEISDRRFGAVVLDYDGTICATHRRYDPPSDQMVRTLTSLLERGMRLGFASGRGPSLPEALQEVLPVHLWPQVTLGIYNGGVFCRLDEELEDLKQPSSLIEEAATRVQELPIAESLKLTLRKVQLTVESSPGTWLKDGLLAELVADSLRRAPSIDVKVVASGHSVDVIPQTSSKVSVFNRLKQETWGLDVLCIGDQGQVGGNDFELLAEEKWSLSVDRTSADPTRCWFLGGSLVGPALSNRYLRAFAKRTNGFEFKVEAVL